MFQRFTQVLHILVILLLLLPMPVKAAEVVLVLPVLRDAQGQLLLWEEDNRWKEAWAQYLGAVDGSGVMLPLGDLEDMDIVSVLPVVPDSPALYGIKSKYGTKKAAILEASYDGTALDVVLTGDFTPQRLRVVGDYLPSMQQAVLEALPLLVQGGSVPMANAPLPSLDNGDNSTLQAILPITGMDDWLQAKHKLESSRQVTKLEVKELRTTQARLAISYSGNYASFVAGLNEQGFLIERHGAEWKLTMQ